MYYSFDVIQLFTLSVHDAMAASLQAARPRARVALPTTSRTAAAAAPRAS